MLKGPKRFLTFIWKSSANPLAISNAATSLAGALSILVAARQLNAHDFATFALVNLISVTSWGFARVALFQPALMRLRHDSLCVVPFRYALAIVAAIFLPITAVYFVVGSTSFETATFLALANSVPIFQDWLRYRVLGNAKRSLIAVSDVARLAIIAGAIPFTQLYSSGFVYQSFIGLSFIVPGLILALGAGRITKWRNYSVYAGDSRAQSADFAISQLSATIPLLILGSFGSSAIIAGVRLAQTIFGPLNLVLSASSMILLADSATTKDYKDDIHLIKQTKLLAWRLALLAVIVVAGGCLIVFLIPHGVFSVTPDILSVGMVSVGALAITSGWSAIHTLTLRLLGQNNRIIVLRVALILGTWACYAAGAALGGIQGSVLTGYLGASALYPFLFGTAAYRLYRQIDQSRDLGK